MSFQINLCVSFRGVVVLTSESHNETIFILTRVNTSWLSADVLFSFSFFFALAPSDNMIPLLSETVAHASAASTGGACSVLMFSHALLLGACYPSWGSCACLAEGLA